MLYAFVPRDAHVERTEIFSGQPLAPNAIWLDLFEPTVEERARVEAELGVSLPSREEMKEIEPSSRLYSEGDAVYMTATVLNRADDPNPSADPITFVLARRTLVTLRYVDPRPVTAFATRIARQPGSCAAAEDALVGLLEAFVDRFADILERVSLDLDQTSRTIFDPSPGSDERDMQAVLKTLGRNDDLASTTRESLLSVSRVARFLGTTFEAGSKKEQKDLKARLKTLDRDIASLAEHSSFETGKVSFLLNATLGMINIEQNRIIKLFSVAAVVFLPPTLVASLYGMNFKHMPELDWTFGYPMAIGLMILSAIVPYMFFKRKGWF
ncbi:MAG: magnesium transporter CorA family protein [Alphaproteobacteria bacterium]|nr:magnesium transporter CorA family protein [Alphaproteobacteria bacterium]